MHGSLLALLLQAWTPVSGTVALEHLELDVPPGFALQKVAGPDYSVYTLRSPMGGSGLGVFFGRQPQTFAPRKGVRQEPARIGRKKLAWSLWQTEEKGVATLHAEVLAVRPFGREPEYATHLHVFIEARSEETLKNLQAIAETLRPQGK